MLDIENIPKILLKSLSLRFLLSQFTFDLEKKFFFLRFLDE